MKVTLLFFIIFSFFASTANASSSQTKWNKTKSKDKGSSAITASVVINDICVEPMIIIPEGCYFTDLLLFNDANYYVEVIKDTTTELTRDGLPGGANTTTAMGMVGSALSASTERSSAGAGVRFKEVNVWELSKDDKAGTYIEDTVKEEMCIWNDDPSEGGYLYKSKEHLKEWRKADDGSALAAIACTLNGLPASIVSGLTSAIKGLSAAMEDCVGSWGTLKPTIGFATHASDIVHAAHVGYRGMENAGVTRGLDVDGMQFGYPNKKGCLDVGEASTQSNPWEEGVKDAKDLFGESDVFLIVIWQREACCIQ